MEPQKHYRHGDVLFTRIDELPSDLTPLDTKTVAEGEVTGHHHRFQNEQTLVYKNDTNLKYVSLVKPDTLIHEEHKDMEMPEGNYAITIEREYDAFTKMEKQVRD